MLSKYRLLCANAVMLIALFGVFWGRRIEDSHHAPSDFLANLAWNYRAWRTQKLTVPKSEAELLQADSIRMERFNAPDKNWIELTVIAGHRKQSIHTPAYCMRGDGWEVVAEEAISLPLGGREIDAIRARITKDGQEMLATYFFTDGEFCTPNLMRFQTVQMIRRFGSQPPLGALVRILTPINGSRDAAATLTDTFAKATLPMTLDAMAHHRMRLN